MNISQVVVECLYQGGVTYNPITEEIVSPLGYIFPAYPDRTQIIPLDTICIDDVEVFVERYSSYFTADRFLGLWISPQQEVYIDIVQFSETQEEAQKHITQVQQTSKRKIVSMYESSTGKEIFL